MELKFDNKISEKQVLSKANKNKSPFELNYNGSMLFMGDNFEVLSILLNNFRGKINLIYIDPPFNTDQEFFVSENGRANSISHSKNDIVAYSDKMSTDEYLEFIRERLILLRELLSDNGSIYLHIDYKIGHYIKIIMDEVFGKENFKNVLQGSNQTLKIFIEKHMETKKI